MVRFSDMLGGSGEPDDAHAANSPYAALASDLPPADPIPDAEADLEPEAEAEAEAEAALEPETEPEPALETPEDVLNRLRQYATSARAAEPAVEEPVVEERVVEERVVEEAVAEPTSDEPTSNEAEATGNQVEPPADDPLSPVGDRDDLLPRAKGAVRRAGRGRKRHP